MNKKIIAAILTVVILSIIIAYIVINSGYFFPSRNIAITNITLSESNVYVGDFVNITVKVKNTGTQNETFTTTAYSNTTSLGTKTVTSLKPGTETDLLYRWNTTGFTPANYYVRAECTTVPSESNTTDNAYTYSMVKVRNKPTHAQVEVYPTPKFAFVGQNVRINITISNVSDLYGWEFNLTWNPTIVEAVDIIQGSFLLNHAETFFTNPALNNTQGTLYAACTLLKDIPGASGDGILASINFHVKTAGDCILQLSDVVLINSFEEPMTATASNGIIEARSISP